MSGATDRAGARWERRAVNHARERGLDWDRMVQRGSRDLLDFTGTLSAGLLVGCKAVHKGVPIGTRLWEAMDQARTAMVNLEQLSVQRQLVRPAVVVPFQLLMRPGSEAGRAYAVTEYDYLLDLARARIEQGW